MGVGQGAFGVGAPELAGEIVEYGCAGAVDGFEELVGEHSFSVRDQVPPKGAHDFRQSSATAKNGSCVGSRFRGVSGLRHPWIFPGFAGHRPAS